MQDAQVMALAQRLGCASRLAPKSGGPVGDPGLESEGFEEEAQGLLGPCAAVLLVAYKQQPALSELVDLRLSQATLTAEDAAERLAIIVAAKAGWILLTDDEVLMITREGLEFLRDYGVEPCLVDLDQADEDQRGHCWMD